MIPDKLLINLKILSKIQKNGKITRSFDGIISLDSDTFYQPIRRFIGNDSRKQAVFEINSIVSEAMETFKHILNCKFMNRHNINTDEYHKCFDNLEILYEEFNLAKCGVENLKFTYQNDQNIVSQLDIILLKMSTTIKDVSSKIKALRPQQEFYDPEYDNNTNYDNTTNYVADLNSVAVEIPPNEDNSPDINMNSVV